MDGGSIPSWRTATKGKKPAASSVCFLAQSGVGGDARVLLLALPTTNPLCAGSQSADQASRNIVYTAYEL